MRPASCSSTRCRDRRSRPAAAGPGGNMHCLWNRIVCGAVAALLVAHAVPAAAIILDDENTIVVVLGDGTAVKLYAEAGESSAVRTRRFYYLPVGLRVAARPDGTP